MFRFGLHRPKTTGTQRADFIETMDSAVVNIIESSIAKSANSYASGFRVWCKFCQETGAGERIFFPSVTDCRRFLGLFINSKTARQYVCHVTHFFNRLGITSQNMFRSEPVKQMFRGMVKREEARGWKKPKPILTVDMVRILIRIFLVAEVALACKTGMGFMFGFRMNNECHPLQWQCGSFAWVRLAFNPAGIPCTEVSLGSRKNFQGGVTMVRSCSCAPKIRNAYKRGGEFNEFCTVHLLIRYREEFPDRFQPGAFLFPDGLRGKDSCSTRALIKVLQKTIKRYPSFFPGVVENADYVTSHILRRSMANAIMESGGSAAEIMGGGMWKAPSAMFAYLDKSVVHERAVFRCIIDADSSDSDDAGENDPDQRPRNRNKPSTNQHPGAKAPSLQQVTRAANKNVDSDDDVDRVLFPLDSEYPEDVFSDIRCSESLGTSGAPRILAVLPVKEGSPPAASPRSSARASPAVGVPKKRPQPKSIAPKKQGRPTRVTQAAATAGANPARFFGTDFRPT